MTEALSEKLRVASFIATLMVVLRHSANWVAFFPPGRTPAWLLDTEWNVLFVTDVAVPFFFFVSGFLFMRVEYLAEGKYLSMLKKKGRVLLFPFLIWNLAGGLVLLFHDNEGNLGNSFSSCIENLCMSHWYGPLWYVRDIMLLMLLYPVYGWLYKKYGQPLVLALILWLMYSQWQPGWTNLLAAEGIVFFLLGGLVQKHSAILEWRSPKWLGLILLAVWIFFSCEITSMNWTIHRLSLIIGLPAFWFALDLIPKSWQSVCVNLAPYSFLIYVTHFYLHKVFKIGLACFFPQNPTVALMSFFIVPIVTVCIIVVAGRFWRQRFPKSYSICVGGRV